MPLGCTARHEATRQFDVPPDRLTAEVPWALTHLGWRYVAVTPWHYHATVPANFCSWGETVDIHIEADGLISVSSVCGWPLQIFDWGKNRRNVERFYAELERLCAGGQDMPLRPVVWERQEKPVEAGLHPGAENPRLGARPDAPHPESR